MRRLIVALQATLVLVACRGTEPAVPMSVAVTPSPAVIGALGDTLRLTARLLDQQQKPIGNAHFTWATDNAAVVTVDTTGRLQAVANGTATVTATTGTLFGSATVTVRQTPTSVLGSGSGQVGLVGFQVNVPPSVLVRDKLLNAIAGVAVNFAVTGGGGSLTGASASTDATGVARVGSWTLGGGAGTNTLTATVTGSGIPGNPVTFTVTGATAAFQVEVRFLTSMSAPRQAVFANAAARWQQLIFGDLPDIQVSGVPAAQCGPNSPAMNETVDDVVIFASIDAIDGPGKILGMAGPCFIRTTGKLPLVGAMIFDDADIPALESAGIFDEVILHEMSHVLGFGTIWPDLGLLSGEGTADSHFTGGQALGAFDRVGGQSFTLGSKVPVENCVGIPQCGSGSQDSHWRESVFGTELLTGFLNGGVTNPLSVVTTASLGDMGYFVNHAASDPYLLSLAALRAPGAAAPVRLEHDILRLPIYEVDPAGRVVRVIPSR